MPATHSPYVLIVEDDPHQAQLLELLLQMYGYTTQNAPDAETALATLATVPPALLTLDLNLPGMSGAELLAQLRMTPATAHLPVILITAFPDVAAGVARQAQAVLTKPYDIDTVIALVREYCPCDVE